MVAFKLIAPCFINTGLRYSIMPRASRQSALSVRLFIADKFCIMHNTASDPAKQAL